MFQRWICVIFSFRIKKIGGENFKNKSRNFRIKEMHGLTQTRLNISMNILSSKNIFYWKLEGNEPLKKSLDNTQNNEKKNRTSLTANK
jgi:hypothetical protein